MTPEKIAEFGNSEMKDGSCCCSATNDQLVSSLPQNFSHQNLCPHNEPSFPITAQCTMLFQPIFPRIIFCQCNCSSSIQKERYISKTNYRKCEHFEYCRLYFTDNCILYLTAYYDKCWLCCFLQNKEVFRILKRGGTIERIIPEFRL